MKTNCAAASNVSRIGIKSREYVTAVRRIMGALVSVRQETVHVAAAQIIRLRRVPLFK